MTTTKQVPIGYNLTVNADGEGFITFVNSKGFIETVPADHPHFARVAHALVSGGDPEQFLDITQTIHGLSDRVGITDDGEIRFDGKAVHTSVADAIARYHDEGRDANNVVRFLERVEANPSERAREELYDWIEHQGLTIDEEGFIVAHKAVHEVSLEDGRDKQLNHLFTTVRRNISPAKHLPTDKTIFASGYAGSEHVKVDGVKYVGKVPQYVGATVEMDRDVCDGNGNVECSTGLHFGTFHYASAFAPKITEVRIDPADVVSVPRYDTTKARCCKYVILAVQDRPNRDLSHYEPTATWDADVEVERVLETVQVPRSFLDKWRERRAAKKRGEA